MKRLPDLLVLLVLAVPASGVASAHAGPPPNMTLVVVGSDGRSVTIEPEPAVLAVLFYAPTACTTCSRDPRARVAATCGSTRSAAKGFRRYRDASIRCPVRSASTGTRRARRGRAVVSVDRSAWSARRDAWLSSTASQPRSLFFTPEAQRTSLPRSSSRSTATRRLVPPRDPPDALPSTRRGTDLERHSDRDKSACPIEVSMRVVTSIPPVCRSGGSPATATDRHWRRSRTPCKSLAARHLRAALHWGGREPALPG